REHGYSDRIEFIQDLSTNVTLPERADVIVSDLHGVLPLHRQHLPSIIDARSRLLAPGGVLIPPRDTLWAAVVEVPERYEELVKPWENNMPGVALSAARTLAVNLWFKHRVTAENLMSQPICWHELDFHKLDDANVCEELSLTLMRGGIAHGLAIWFDTELFGGAGFSNAPGGEKVIYGNAFFPFKEAIEVETGDHIDVRLEARLIGDDYVWRWDTTIRETRFKQSTLFGAPLSPSQLRKRTATYKPSLNAQGEVRSFILKLMNGENSLSEIATRVVERFPERYADWNEAFSEVADISRDFSG
ncbi:MAG TPA: hypothetical protein VJS17_12345, partial [Pyrinomonadaceae bacterium]|nr:hypothetical protein [Pyrinomonadaceae bacterium]